MKTFLIASAIAVSLLSTGCSTIVSKSDYPVSISSSPEGANFTITNKNGIKVHSGMTPSTVVLKASSGYFSGESYTLTFDKYGYPTKIYTINSSVDGWYFGNILFGGILGMLIIDPATGAMFTLPEKISVSLNENKNKSLKLMNINDLSEEDILNLVKLTD